MSDPVLNDSPWGYWPLSFDGADVSGNGRDLTIHAGGMGGQEFGGYSGFDGLYGTRGLVEWSTGFSPSGDWSMRIVVQRDGYGDIARDDGAAVTWGGTTLSGPGGGSWSWGWTPYNIPVVVYLVASGGTINYWFADWTSRSDATSGSFGGSFTGPIRFSSRYMYASVAVFDYALSPWRVAIQMTGAEPELPSTAQNLVTEMLADSPQAVYAVPSEYDTVPDEAGSASDATLTAGTGFDSAATTNAGFDSADSEWDLPVALDTGTFTVEFGFRAATDSPVDDVDVFTGDVSVTAIGSGGTITYTATAGGDTATWSTGWDPNAHLVGVTWDSGGDLILYVDGVARDTVTVTGSIAPDPTVTVQSGDPSQFVGTVAVYDTALSGARMAAHAATILPPLMHRVEVDDFDRADGPIGNTSFLGLPWTARGGTPVVASNGATGGMATVVGIPTPMGVVASISDGGSSDTATIGLWSDGVGSGTGLYGAMVDFGSGNVSLITQTAPASWLTSGGPYPADLSAGVIELRVQFDRFATFEDLVPAPSTDEVWAASVWVDDVLIASNVPFNGLRSFTIGQADMYTGEVVAPVGWDTSGPTTLEWIDALEGFHELGQPAQPDQTGGLEFRFWPFDGVLLGSSTQGSQTGGLAPPPDPIRDSRPVFLGASPNVPQRGGIHTIWTNGTPPAPPAPPPGYPQLPPPWVGVGSPPSDLQVSGHPYRVAASCQPTLNNAGSGSFTVVPPGPALGDEITFTSGGSAVFTGYADSITTVQVDPGEESGQLVTAECVDLLSIDWTETVVWPDFGAFEPIRLGAPPQDDREWGWPMNGLLDDQSVAGIVPSFGNDPARWGTPDEVLPIPSDWPDSTARWMWDITPDWTAQPQGWVYFQVPFGTWPGRHAIFLNAWDYAKCWVDGALVAEVTTPGQTVRFDVDFDWDFHLVAIAAYNEGGPAGVMFSCMKHSTDGSGLLATGNGSGLDAPAMNSRGGWKCLPYPEHSLRGSTGYVLRRLVREASARGAPAGQWTCSFTDEADSNGAAWPDDDNTVVTKTGQTYWDVLNMLAEDRIDFHTSPSGRTLYAYRKGDGAGSVSQPWAPGVHAESLEVTVSGR